MGRRLDRITLGPQRRSRRMMRRLKELDRHDAKLRDAGRDPLDEWHRSRDPRPTTTLPTRTSRGRQRGPAVIAVILAVAITALIAWHDHAGSSTGAAVDAARPATLPPAGVGEHQVRIGDPAPAPAGDGGYLFERTQPDGTAPVTWDPCRAIHYTTSGGAPTGMARVVRSVLTEVRRLTGFRFVNDGATSEQPGRNRPGYQPDRYGARWAPVLIAWTTPATVPALAGHTIGLGGAYAVSWNSASRTYVSGIVYLDEPQFRAALADRRPLNRTRAMLRAVVLHEVGHLLGLAHVRDRASIMFPEAGLNVTDYSAGDRRGLRALSEGSCAPNL
jgi:hypothetical protein